MATQLQTRRLTRDKLASFLTSHEAIKAFEALIYDVSDTIGPGLDANASTAEEALALAQAAEALLLAQRTQQSTISALERRIEQLEALLIGAR
jgi:hypothetical protein